MATGNFFAGQFFGGGFFGAITPTPPPTPNNGSGGGGRYFGEGRMSEELEALMLEAQHAEQVREAVVEAVTHHYYAPGNVAKNESLAKLAQIAEALQFRITKQDRALLALMVTVIKMEMDDDDEAISLLLH